MRAIAGKAFRDIRTAALLAGLIGAVLAASVAFLFESYSSAIEGLKDLALYQGFTGSSVNIAEPAGFLAAGYFAWMPFLVIVIGVLGGTGALSAQEEDGTLDLVLAQPVPRWKVITGTALGLGAAVTLATALAIPAFAISIPLADLDLSVWRATGAVILTMPLILLHLALGLWFAAVLPSRGTAVTATVGVTVFGYLVQVMGGIASDLEPLQKVSPFYWAEAGKAMADGFPWGRFVAMSAGVAILMALATRSFGRREIAVSRPLQIPMLTRLLGPRKKGEEEPVRLPTRRAIGGPIRFPVARRAALGMRGGALGIGLTSFLMAVMLGYYYPEVVAELDDLGDLDWITDLTGPAGAYTTPAGFFTLEFFSWIPLLYMAIGVAAATAAVGSEESQGTMDLVLGQPLARRRFILEKAAGIAIALLVSIALSVPGFAIAIPLGDLDIGIGTVSKAILMMGALVFMHSALALWLATWLATRSAAAILTSGIITGGYVLQLLGSLVPALDDARKVSPFYWSDAAEAMVNGINPGFLAALVSLTALFTWLAVVTFDRREIAAGRGGGRPGLRGFLEQLAQRGAPEGEPSAGRAEA